MPPSASRCSAAPRWPWPTSTPPAACSARRWKLIVGDDACDPKQAVAAANKWSARAWSSSPATSAPARRSRPRQVYEEENILQISPASTNPKLTDEGGANVFRVCGRDDQQGMVAGRLPGRHLRRQEGRHRSRQDRLRQGPGRRDQEGDERGRPAGGHVRGLHRGREGLLGADLQDEGGRHRRALRRRLPHRGRPDGAPDARPGHTSRSWSPATRWSPTSTGRSPATPARAR